MTKRGERRVYINRGKTGRILYKERKEEKTTRGRQQDIKRDRKKK
jgi:hypothetical protein